jgi:hypothetical protein
MVIAANNHNFPGNGGLRQSVVSKSTLLASKLPEFDHVLSVQLKNKAAAAKKIRSTIRTRQMNGEVRLFVSFDLVEFFEMTDTF